MKNMNIKKNISVVGAILLSMFVFAGVLSLNTNTAEASDCGSSGVRSEVYVEGTTAFVSVSNDNGDCTVPVNLKSYKMFDTVLANQTLYDNANVTVGPNSTQTVRVNIPQCVTQIDAYLGEGPTIPAPGYTILSWTFASNGVDVGHSFPSGNYCTNTPPPPPPPPPPVIPTLDGSCSVTPASVNVGGSINWSATATGGTGSYAYSWTGTDSLTGTNSTAVQTYSNAGNKTASVTITSGTQSVVKTCSAVVTTPIINQNLSVSCSASPSSVPTGSSVSWSASATGGNGSYNYSWTGTDGLSGNSAYISNYYNNSGTKYAYVTVTSNGQTATQTCTANVYDNNNYDNNLYISCYASPSNPRVGSQMNWYATVSGGNGGYYNYSWTGTDGLYSNNQSPYMVYNTSGSKLATVSVMGNNGQRVTANCYAYVNQNSVLAYSSSYQAPLASAVYLSEIPSTGIFDNMRLIYFVGFLALVSAWIAYIIISYKKESGELN